MARALRISDSIVLHLEQGKHYRASRPLAVEGLDVFPVSVIDLDTGQYSHVTVPSSYDEAMAIVVQINEAIKEAGYG